MLLQEVFDDDVTRAIAPVIYFHEQDPGRVAQEASEYIITGGYPESDPRHQRIPRGIHEQYVKLLQGITAGIRKKEGTELPASWISGFYGSGKSSFAKLLGLALDGMKLPDGKDLAEALLARDDSPNSHQLRDAWHDLRSRVDPIAVVFDIGSVARDDEDIPSATKREIQRRLGYCPVSHYVAEHELKLELEGQWDDFLAAARKTLGRDWHELKDGQLAEDHFSAVLHEMDGELYTDPMSWLDSRAGTRTGIGTSAQETTRAIADMLEQRQPGKTLFIVVDEVSQYIFQSDSRQLKLQSFVSDLGKRLKGRVWLLATGQQQLDDSADAGNIGKLKDRFPERLRVHLEPANIRDVVHKRLLRKDPAREDELRQLFQSHRHDLKLYGYACDSITAEDFLEVYPLLPGHVDLLMQVTSNLRLRSSRIKGDDYAIRGLLQLLGELFRRLKLGERELGALVTLDDVYEIQQSDLDADTQNSMARVLAHDDVAGDELARRVAKAVALLEMIQEQTPTTPELVAQCLYDRLGRGDREGEVRRVLEGLKQLGLLSYSAKYGYKVQSSAGQEWQRERDTRHVTLDEKSAIVHEKLRELLGSVDRPQYRGRSFPWNAYYTDGRTRHEERFVRTSDHAVVAVDFRYLTAREERASNLWMQASAGALRHRLVWVVGRPGDLPSKAQELAKSRYVVQRYASRVQSLGTAVQRCFFDEQSNVDDLESKVRDAVAEAFLAGEVYFDGRPIDKHGRGTTFAAVLQRVAEDTLPALYGQFVEIAITPKELEQLLSSELQGSSRKFLPEGLGILEHDAGRLVATCRGEVPQRIRSYVVAEDGCPGAALLAHFGGPPYGHPADVVKACLAGLLRAGLVRIRPESGPEITSYGDPDARNMFERDRDLKRADILPPSAGGLKPRDRVAIVRFFEERLGKRIERENEAIADAVFDHFPGKVKDLQDLEGRYNRLPGRPDLPDELVKMRSALEECTRSRRVEDTVLNLRKRLDDLGDGIQLLGILRTELNDDAVAAVRRASDACDVHAAQLEEIDALSDDDAKAASLIRPVLEARYPWRGLADLTAEVEKLRATYADVRRSFVERQDERADQICQRLRQRRGFSQLSADQSFHVLRPVEECLVETTADAVQPPLVDLRDGVDLRLARAEDEAERRLDHVLSDVTDAEVVPLRLGLKGREITGPEDVEDVLRELRERLLAQLAEAGEKKIRIRLI